MVPTNILVNLTESTCRSFLQGDCSGVLSETIQAVSETVFLGLIPEFISFATNFSSSFWTYNHEYSPLSKMDPEMPSSDDLPAMQIYLREKFMEESSGIPPDERPVESLALENILNAPFEEAEFFIKDFTNRFYKDKEMGLEGRLLQICKEISLGDVDTPDDTGVYRNCVVSIKGV